MAFNKIQSYVLPSDDRTMTGSKATFQKEIHTDNISYSPMSSSLYCSPKSIHVAPGISNGTANNPDLSAFGRTVALKSTNIIPERFRFLFPFSFFNRAQSEVFDSVLYTDNPLVVCSPTGSGKTVVFELAIVNLLMKLPAEQHSTIKIIYVAPIKALCHERFLDWNEKLSKLGLVCTELTGDSDVDSYTELQQGNVIITTPEKWDSISRRWKNNKLIMQLVRLFLVDEIHMLGDKQRGASLEVIVSRMKAVQSSTDMASDSVYTGGSALGLRFIAVSATLPNIEDIAEWLGSGERKAVSYKLDDMCRPVKLRKVVLGYPSRGGTSAFKFDIGLTYKLANVIATYSNNKPTLVFCSTRKGTVQACTILSKEMHFTPTMVQKQGLLVTASQLKDGKLRDLVLTGVAYHHAGVTCEDRNILEELFLSGQLPVLLCTSTLAMGVNLPAHLVILKSTEHYVGTGFEEYTETEILQMIGRAGRPQFDTFATAVIMTRQETKVKYERLLSDTLLIESSLQNSLYEHMNSEIAQETITDIPTAMKWLRSTFFYIRLFKNPNYYNLPTGLTKHEIEKRLEALCRTDLIRLDALSVIQLDRSNNTVWTTNAGRLMAKFCISLVTMEKILSVKPSATLHELILLIAGSGEFFEIQVRQSEKKLLNQLNKDKNHSTIRFPMDGKINTAERKINCLIQAQLGCLSVPDFGLTQETTGIFRGGIRAARCLFEYLWTLDGYYTVLVNAALLIKCLKSKLWEDSKFVSRQLDGIGLALSTALVNAGMTTFEKITKANPRELELILNRHPPFGNTIQHAVAHLPKYTITLNHSSGLGCRNSSSDAVRNNSFKVEIFLCNHEELTKSATLGLRHQCVVLVGDFDNNTLLKFRLSDQQLVDANGKTVRNFNAPVQHGSVGKIEARLISFDAVGLDVSAELTPTGPTQQVQAVIPVVKKAASFIERKRTAHPVRPGDIRLRNITQTMNNTDFDKDTLDFLNDLPDDGRSVSGRRPCSHRCLNKSLCAHECCKFGLATRPTKPGCSSAASSLTERVRTAPPIDTYFSENRQRRESFKHFQAPFKTVGKSKNDEADKTDALTFADIEDCSPEISENSDSADPDDGCEVINAFKDRFVTAGQQSRKEERPVIIAHSSLTGTSGPTRGSSVSNRECCESNDFNDSLSDAEILAAVENHTKTSLPASKPAYVKNQTRQFTFKPVINSFGTPVNTQNKWTRDSAQYHTAPSYSTPCGSATRRFRGQENPGLTRAFGTNSNTQSRSGAFIPEKRKRSPSPPSQEIPEIKFTASFPGSNNRPPSPPQTNKISSCAKERSQCSRSFEEWFVPDTSNTAEDDHCSDADNLRTFHEIFTDLW